MDQRPCMRRFVQFENDGPVLFEEETLMYTKEGVDFTFNPETPTIPGTLYITSRRVIWASEELAYDFDVPYILDVEEGEGAEDEPTEMYFVPASEGDLQEMFDAFSQAAVLNPDPDFDEDDDGLIYNTEEVQLGAEQAARLDHLESVFRLPGEEPVQDSTAVNGDGQFVDADDEQEEEDVSMAQE